MHEGFGSAATVFYSGDRNIGSAASGRKPAGLSAGDIAVQLASRQNTMSTHLKQLNQAGLIDSRRDGRSVIYTANYETARELILFLTEDCCASHAEVCGPLARSLAKS